MESESETENDAFYFESDHLPLRGNQDYSNVLRTIALLESCKLRLHQQISELERLNKAYKANPLELLEKIRTNKEIVPMCGEIKIPQLPELIGTYEFLKPAKSFAANDSESAAKGPTVRGRLIDETKPETFNKLWTCEEQRRLEELLIKYPPERKEMRRYAKIAEELGSRTPLQVCSRVQKYFKKLSDAGMPIPGRRPKNRRTAQGKFKNLQKPSTFFPAYNVRVTMPEDDEFENDEWRMSMHSNDTKSECAEASDDGDIPASPPLTAYTETEAKKRNAKTLYILKELRVEKEMCGESYQPDPMAALCDRCQIQATTLRPWHCRTCHLYLKQCADCMIDELITDSFKHLMHDIVVDD